MSSWPLLFLRSSKPAGGSPIRYLPSYFRCDFSTSIRQCAAKKVHAPSKALKHAPKPTRAPASSSYKPFSQSLAERSEPILLYQGASNTIYMLGCYSLGLLISGWSIHSSRQIHNHPPPYFNRFLRIMLYGVCALAAGMGALFIIRPYRIVQTIQALPVTSRGVRTLHLQIESARVLPGIRPSTVSVPASDITISHQLHADKYNGIPAEVLEQRRKEAEKFRKLREGNFMTLPIRQLGFHVWKGFQALKKIFSSNPFIYIRAKGYQGSWKLGSEAGWALDEGRAIDRIVKTSAM
ncbi:MAG: hypothetical protein Q9219_002729 [cf. Caloplaca sp. 3 TL-2023]